LISVFLYLKLFLIEMILPLIFISTPMDVNYINLVISVNLFSILISKLFMTTYFNVDTKLREKNQESKLRGSILFIMHK
jgi:hypothetical protein